jgi:hypothetical protein
MENITENVNIIGSKFRPVHWSDLYEPGAPIIGWGIERKQKGKHRYIPVGINGEIHPYKTKKEAQEMCDSLNGQASVKDTHTKLMFSVL